MQFTPTTTDGIAHQGILTINKQQIHTPNLLYLQTSHINAPQQAELLLTSQHQSTKKPTIQVQTDLFEKSTKKTNHKKSYSPILHFPKDTPLECHKKALKTQQKNKPTFHIIPPEKKLLPELVINQNTTLFIVANTTQLYKKQHQFIDFLIALRQHIGYEKVLYLPTIADPTNLSLFVYMGIDLFDTTTALIAARQQTLLFPIGNQPIKKLRELPCSCPYCHQKKPTQMTYQDILNHNYQALNDELKHIRNAITNGSLRELVETRIRSNPTLTAMLRLLDQKHSTYYEQHTPLYRSATLLATTPESLNRPEIKRFQHHLITNYQKPPSTTTLLLLPCSAKKPYSTSKSHQLFNNTIQPIPNSTCIHKIIITSPLGLVPQELENIYPASNYDIPVTGHWTAEEQEMIIQLLQKYLQNNHYNHIILHLQDSLNNIIKKILPTATITCQDNNPTSNRSLHTLSQQLHQICSLEKSVKKTRRIKEHFHIIASFQFRKTTGEKIYQNTTIQGRYPHYKLINKNSKQLGMITTPRGLISLTLEGGKRVFQSNEYWVQLYNDFQLKGSVFAPGIQNADEKIRRGDDVVVVQNETVCGVGVALMCGEEMMARTSGEAVKIRHHMSSKQS